MVDLKRAQPNRVLSVQGIIYIESSKSARVLFSVGPLTQPDMHGKIVPIFCLNKIPPSRADSSVSRCKSAKHVDALSHDKRALSRADKHEANKINNANTTILTRISQVP